MARFRSVIRGSKSGASDVSRIAHSSQTVIAQSWDGQVRVEMRHGSPNHVVVTLEPHEQSANGEKKVLYDGPMSGWNTTTAAE